MKGKEVMAQIFTGASKAYDFFLSFATLGSIHRWQRELIEAMGREGNWLDVGTGTGEVLKKLGSYPHLRVGIDLRACSRRLRKSAVSATSCWRTRRTCPLKRGALAASRSLSCLDTYRTVRSFCAKLTALPTATPA